ncbi:hypothetical protein [Saccharopolyspora mangrovi]|uniref:Uncharacterized protein n=1 Tax=Saccharopolyspora mangrovi TaxID=3082379 RepID=A0ABU6A5I5_9PSEU|nr:hypothetical protein [Saccharopolyspora sp. S2-29]MEB3366629.1 hypothetical protein [Saccharopolyspora sp. S2-29]
MVQLLIALISTADSAAQDPFNRLAQSTVHDMARMGRTMTNGMAQLLSMAIPLMLFMVSPALIPLIGWLVGTLRDLIARDRRHGLQSTSRSLRGHRRDPRTARDQEA